jgi:hypothetical protein
VAPSSQALLSQTSPILNPRYVSAFLLLFLECGSRSGCLEEADRGDSERGAIRDPEAVDTRHDVDEDPILAATDASPGIDGKSTERPSAQDDDSDDARHDAEQDDRGIRMMAHRLSTLPGRCRKARYPQHHRQMDQQERDHDGTDGTRDGECQREQS